MISLNEVGAFPSVSGTNQYSVKFGLYLPGIQSTAGFDAVVRIIHCSDRFDPNVPTNNFPLTWQPGHALDLWSADVTLAPLAGTNMGSPGKYLYRFELWWTPPGGTRQKVSPWITDPFARDAEIGNMAAFTVSPPSAPFQWTDHAYRTPELDDLVVYELQVEEFNNSFRGVQDRLVYLKSLGVNCLELMPVYSMKLDFDWGYGPLYYFSPSSRFGGVEQLKQLVDAAHALGIAVVLDVVYEHTDILFPFYCVYNDLAKAPDAPQIANPFMHGLNKLGFGPKPDLRRALTQEYFVNVNRYWLDEFHVDGFRYDEVTEMYAQPEKATDPPAMDAGYREIVKQTYTYSLSVPRFGAGSGADGYSRIIQCAEALGYATTVISQGYTNAVWQNGLLDLAEAVASGAPLSDSYAHQLDPSFSGYPGTAPAVDADLQPVQMPVAPFQYIESHDHSQLIVFAGPGDSKDPEPEGNRDRWFKLQPHAIALYTLQGIPMLWQGQEFADNYELPGDGLSRVHLARITHWQYFYDANGSALVNLYRRLGTLRRTTRALRSRSSFYYWHQSLQGNQVLLYSRHAAAEGTDGESWALVLLNFGDESSNAEAPFPSAGTWREMLDNSFRAAPYEVTTTSDSETVNLNVGSNYGQVWVKVS